MVRNTTASMDKRFESRRRPSTGRMRKISTITPITSSTNNLQCTLVEGVRVLVLIDLSRFEGRSIESRFLQMPPLLMVASSWVFPQLPPM